MEPCVIDASIILNLGPIRGLYALTESDQFAWKVTPIVRGEVKHSESRMALERAILDGRIELVELDTNSDSEIALFARFSETLDPGEAETIALATARRWVVAIEDRKGQRAINQEVGPGRWINCANLLLDAVASGRTSFSEADTLFQRLSCYPGYVRNGILSLDQLRS